MPDDARAHPIEQNGPRARRVLLVLGTGLMVFGLLLLPWLLPRWLGITLTPARQWVSGIVAAVCLLGGAWTILGRRRPLLLNLWLMAGATVFVLLAVEVVLRFTQEPRYKLIRTPEPYVHHTLAPNASEKENWGRSTSWVHTNALGFRDLGPRTIPRESPHATRLLFLGDSFTEGEGVEYEDTFVYQTERLLQETGWDVEALNGGVVSYAPRLMYRRLKQFLDAGYTADQVLVFLDLSDLANEALDYRHWESFSEEQMAEMERLRRKRARLNRLVPSLFTFVERRAQALQRRFTGAGDYPDHWAHPEERSTLIESDSSTTGWRADGWAICAEYLLRIRDLCAEHGIAFTLAIYPHPLHLQQPGTPSRYHAQVNAFASANDLPLLDLFPVFHAVPDWRSYYIPGDIHWNEAGHRLVAQEVAAALNRQVRP